MIEVAHHAIEAEVVSYRPLEFSFNTPGSRCALVNGNRLLEGITRGVLNRHHGVTLQVFILGIKRRQVQAQRSIQ